MKARKSIFFNQIINLQATIEPNNDYKIRKNFLVLINRIPLLSHLSKGLLKEQKNKLLDIILLKELHQGDVLYNIGQYNDNFYILLKGNIKSEETNEIYSEFGTILNLNEKIHKKLTKETLIIDKKTFLFEINYNSFVIYEKLSSNQNVYSYLHYLTKFDIINQSNISQKFLEIIFKYFQFKKYSKDDLLCKENTEINNENFGLYFICKGNFIITKKQYNKKSKDDEIEKIEIENTLLKKENDYLLKCVNGNIKFKTPKKQNTTKKIFLSKSIFNDIKLAIVGPYNIIGEIEYIIKAKKFPYTVKCLEDDSDVYFLPIENLKQIKNEELIKNIRKIGEEKMKILSNKYYKNLFVEKEKDDISKVNITDLEKESKTISDKISKRKKKIKNNILSNNIHNIKLDFPILNSSRNKNIPLTHKDARSLNLSNELIHNNNYQITSYSLSKKNEQSNYNIEKEGMNSFYNVNDLSDNHYYMRLGIRKVILNKSIFKTEVIYSLKKNKPNAIKNILLKKPSNKIRFVFKK